MSKLLLSPDDAQKVLEEIHQPTESDKETVEWEISLRLAQGETLKQVGNAFGRTGEWARFAVSKTPWNAPAIREVLKGRADEEKEAAHKEKERLVIQWSHEHEGEPLTEAIDTLGMTRKEIRQILGERVFLHTTTRATRKDQKSSDDIVEGIREYIKQNPKKKKCAATEYAEWARENGHIGPQGARLRFGSWRNALAAAGVETGTRTRKLRGYRETDLWAAVIEAIEETDGTLWSRTYVTYSQKHPGMPSLSTLRFYLGLTWPVMCAEALRVTYGTSDRDPAWVEDVRARRDWTRFPDYSIDQDPFDMLRQARDDIGELFTRPAFDAWLRERDLMTSSALMKAAGATSWSQFLDEAGISGVRRDAVRPDYPDDPLTVVRQAHEKIGQYLNRPAFNTWARANNLPSSQFLIEQAGVSSWSELVTAAGVEISTDNEADGKRKKVEARDVTALVRQARKDIDGNFTQVFFDVWLKKNGYPKSQVLMRVVGVTKWSELLDKAGVEKIQRAADAEHVRDSVVRFLNLEPDGNSSAYERWAALTPDAVSLSTIVRHYGSWDKARAAHTQKPRKRAKK